MTMKNNFSKTGINISIIDIERIEKHINVKFPSDFINHYIEYNGGFPDRCYWTKYGDIECIWLKKFLKLNESTDGNRSLEEIYLFVKKKNFLPESFCPFAIDHGGNFFCFDTSGSIYYFTVDGWLDSLTLEENQKKSTHLICGSLVEFIQGLVDEDEAY